MRGKGREEEREGIWIVGRRGCDNDRCLTNRGFYRRGEKRKNAQSHIGPQGESRTASNWITFTTAGERKVHSTHSYARIFTEAEKQVSKMLVVTLWITGKNHLPDKAFHWGWRYSWAQTARAVLCSSRTNFHMSLIKLKKVQQKHPISLLLNNWTWKFFWFPRNVWMTL